MFNHKLCAGISYALCNIPFKVILSELHDRKGWTEHIRTDRIIHFLINVATKTCVCMSWTGSVLHAVQWDAYHSSNDINHKTIQKETCQWAQVINHERGTVALRGMKMISLLDEWLTWLWAQGVEQRGEVLLITMKPQTGAYLMELRKIFVRKLLATCTSFSEGIFWVTISIFIFLGSRGRNTHTKSSPTIDRTHSRRFCAHCRFRKKTQERTRTKVHLGSKWIITEVLFTWHKYAVYTSVSLCWHMVL